MEAAKRLSIGRAARDCQQPKRALHQAVRLWTQELAVRQYAARSPSERDDLQPRGNGPRKSTESVSLLDVPVGEAAAVAGSARRKGAERPASLVALTSLNLPRIYPYKIAYPSPRLLAMWGLFYAYILKK